MTRLFALLLIAAAPLVAKDYRARRFDVTFKVESGGSARVTETVVFEFGHDSFSYVFRDLPKRGHDGFSDIRASMDGRVLGPGEAEIRSGRSVRVTWHFAPVSNSVHTFELSYAVNGIVSKGTEADKLSWPVIPRDHRYGIDRGSLTLEYPEAATLRQPPRLLHTAAAIETGPRGARLSFQDLRPEHGATLEAFFEAGALISAPPRWQSEQIDRSRRNAEAVPVGLGIFALTLAAGLVVILRVTGPLKQDIGFAAASRLRVTQPPGTLHPAIAGRLATGDNGSASNLALATLFDFARRGIIRIEEMPKGRFGARNFVVRRGDAPGPLRPHEHVLLDTLFETRRGPRESCRMSDFGQSLAGCAGRFADAIRGEMSQAGLLDLGRFRTRRRILMASALLLCGAGLLVIPGLLARGADVFVAAGVFGAAAASAVLGIAGIIAGSSVSSFTTQGAATAAAWRSFAAYVKDITRGREPGPGPEGFDVWLPYAAGFGYAEAWTKHYSKQGVSVPAWFHALETADGSEIAAMVGFVSATSSAGDGSGGADGGGGGASGAG